MPTIKSRDNTEIDYKDWAGDRSSWCHAAFAKVGWRTGARTVGGGFPYTLFRWSGGCRLSRRLKRGPHKIPHSRRPTRLLRTQVLIGKSY
jgi:hypothetical protein